MTSTPATDKALKQIVDDVVMTFETVSVLSWFKHKRKKSMCNMYTYLQEKI